MRSLGLIKIREGTVRRSFVVAIPLPKKLVPIREKCVCAKLELEIALRNFFCVAPSSSVHSHIYHSIA